MDIVIVLFASSDNTIVGNNIHGNGVGHGAMLYLFSNNNVVTGNNIENTGDGIACTILQPATLAGNNIKGSNAWGIWLDCSSNIIYHNNFIDSAWGHVNSQSGTVSIWNNSCEGNYWSEYNGTDSNGDGIGDTPYIIDSNNVDHYPLMNQYWIPADVNHDLKIDILDVVKITGAYGSTPISPFWNPHADIAQPSGKIARAKRGKSHTQ